MAKIFSMGVAVVFGIAFVGLGVVQAKNTLTGSSPIIVASGKVGEGHGKAGDDHGKKKGHAKKKKTH